MLNKSSSGLQTLALGLTVSLASCGLAPEDGSDLQSDQAAGMEARALQLSATSASPRARDQVAEEIRRSYARSRAGQAEELLPMAPKDGSVATPGKAQPIGIMYDQNTGKYRFWLYSYVQTLAGIPVHGSELSVLVSDQQTPPSVWVSSRLRDLGSFTLKSGVQARAVDAEKSRQAVAGMSAARSQGSRKPSPPAISRFTEPQLVIYAGQGEQAAPPRLAIRYFGVGDTPANAWRFVSDAETGEVLHARSVVSHDDVVGTVNALATGNDAAAHCAAPVNRAMPYAKVEITDGASAYADATGHFTVSNPGTSAVDVSSSINGKYFVVNERRNSPTYASELLTQSVVPPGPADFIHNPGLYGNARMEADAYIAANKVRDWVLHYDPLFDGVADETAFPLDVNVNRESCQSPAWYMNVPPIYPPTIRFCQETEWNLNGEIILAASGTFGDLVYHEYTHHLIDLAHPSWENADNAYGEGMGDAVGSLIAGRPEHGLGLDKNDTACTWYERTANNACLYSATDCSSCGDEIHACGTLLSGIIWSIRSQLQATHPSDYQDIINRLVIAVIKRHANPTIDASLLQGFLTVDDDDGVPENGTPHRTEICAGFAAHGIQCPALPGPCSAYCSNPLRFSWSGSYQSGNLGTGAVCRETMQSVAGGNCGNLAGGRALYVNGRQMTCNNQNWSSLPPPVAGGYCVTTTPGDYPWAFFTLW